LAPLDNGRDGLGSPNTSDAPATAATASVAIAVQSQVLLNAANI